MSEAHCTAPPLSRPDLRAILEALRADARDWWYHRQLREHGNVAEARRREVASVRSGKETIRAARRHGGFLSIGRGGATVYHAPGARLSGLHGHGRAAYRLALPVIDTEAVPADRIVRLACSGPMPGLASEPYRAFVPGAREPRDFWGVPVPWGSFDVVPWPKLLRLYRAAGATLENITEAAERAAWADTISQDGATWYDAEGCGHATASSVGL